tara:strand:+ start:324 stop:545 length:222 start_codon:yes stop_codon:yes gene_type:complete
MNLTDCQTWLEDRGYRLISRYTCSGWQSAAWEYEVITPDLWSKRFKERDLVEWVSDEADKQETKAINFMNSMA